MREGHPAVAMVTTAAIHTIWCMGLIMAQYRWVWVADMGSVVERFAGGCGFLGAEDEGAGVVAG